MKVASQKMGVLAAAFAVASALFSSAGDLHASQPGPRFDSAPPATRSTDVAPELEGIAIKDKSGGEVPKDVTLTDQDGKKVTLGDYIDGKRPVLLALAYYECPMLCSLVLTGVLGGIKPLRWAAGEEYRVVVVSFDPRDTPASATAKRDNYLQSYGRKIGERGFDFLVGDEAQVKRVADAVGFSYRWDERQKQYAHAAGAFVLTPTGKISRTLYGMAFPEMRLALLEASEGKIGTVVEQFLLYCFHYDPASRGYILATMRFVKASGAITLLALLAFLFRYWRAERRRLRDEGDVYPAAGPGNLLPERRS